MSELRIVKDGTVYEVEWWRAVRGTPVLAVVARDAEAVIYRTADGRVEKVTRYLTRENGEEEITRLSGMVKDRDVLQVWPRTLFSEPPKQAEAPEPELPEINPFSAGWDVIAHGSVTKLSSDKYCVRVLYRMGDKTRIGWISQYGAKESTTISEYAAQEQYVAMPRHEKKFAETFPGGPLSVTALQWYRIEELGEERTPAQWLEPSQFPADRFRVLSYDDVRHDKGGEQCRRVILRDPRNRCVSVTVKPDGKHVVREINAMTARAEFRKMAHRSMSFLKAFPGARLRPHETDWIKLREQDGAR